MGFRTAAMALTDDSISIDDPVLKTEPKLAIIMGTEGDGLRTRQFPKPIMWFASLCRIV